jgi:hypothetical protein
MTNLRGECGEKKCWMVIEEIKSGPGEPGPYMGAAKAKAQPGMAVPPGKEIARVEKID